MQYFKESFNAIIIIIVIITKMMMKMMIVMMMIGSQAGLQSSSLVKSPVFSSFSRIAE